MGTGTAGQTVITNVVIISFTHNCQCDAMLPGLAPTSLRAEFPVVVLAEFDDLQKITSTTVFWDQASVLVQLGMINPVGLPVGGKAVLDHFMQRDLPPNPLVARWSSTSTL